MAKALRAWSGSAWVLVSTGSGGGGSASGTPFNIPSTLVARSASGSFQIGSVDFHTASPVVSAIGRITWDDGEGTAVLGLGGGNVNLKIGQEELARCYNGTGSTISKGSVVYISGAQGQRPRISLSNASTEATSSKTFGIAAESIADGAEGLVCTFGIVEGIDTSAFTDGSSLWLSASSGLMTNTIPVAPIHMVFVGYCIKSHATAGRIFVKPQNGYEIQELHNVLINGVNNTHILSYNSASSLWMNKDLQAAVKEIDGAGSGIDADLLDGQDASYFLNTSPTTQEKIGDVTFHGTLTVNELVVSGSSTFIATQDLTVTDSLIFLASDQYTTDALDIGFIGSYGDGTTSSAAHYHASFVRDASQNKWKLLSNGPAPVNNIIDYSDPSVEYGVLQLKAVEVSSSVTVTNLNSDMLDDQHGSYYLDWNNTISKPSPIIGVQLTGSITGAASATLTDLGNGQITITTSGGGSASVDWLTQVNDKPDPIIGVSLTGAITGAASATLTDLTNGQVNITTSYGAISTNSQTGTSYNLLLSDAGKIIEMNNAAANLVIIPLDSSQPFPVGTKIDIIQTGAGATSASVVSGVTLNSEAGKRTVNAQWQAATLVKRATDTWVMIGALKA